MKSTITLTPVSVPPRERRVGGRQSGKLWSLGATSYRKQWPDCNDQDQSIPWETDGAIKYEDIVEKFNMKKKEKFEGVSQWSLNDWISILAKGGRAKKRFHYCLNPNSFRHTLYFRAIQGHSGGIPVDPELHDNVLFPKGFTEYIYLVGNVREVHSIIRSGLIPGGPSLNRGRQSMFFTIANPMEDEKCVEETSCDLTKPWIVPQKENLETSS